MICYNSLLIEKGEIMDMNPILNNPYQETAFHYATNDDGSLNVERIEKRRRVFIPDIQPVSPNQQQDLLYDVNQLQHNDGFLIIQITGMNRNKEDKKFYVENRWLPAVRNVWEKEGYAKWTFIEIVNDMRDIYNQLKTKIEEG